jgi:hypothetical protein
MEIHQKTRKTRNRILQNLAGDVKVFISHNRLGLRVISQREPRWMQTLVFDPMPSNTISLPV